MAIGGPQQIWNLIRELDLGDIRERADAPFALVVAGEADAAREVAELVARAPGQAGVHPWVTVLPLPLSPRPLPAAPGDAATWAVVVARGARPTDDERGAARRLAEAGARVVTLVRDDAATATHGADAPLGGEAARVVLPERVPAADLRRALAHALVEVEAAPDAAVALARRLPLLREPIVRLLVEEVAQANAWYAVTTGAAEVIPGFNVPLVVADVVVMTKNQLIMAYRIALAAGKSGEARDVLGELFGVIGGGLMLRQAARTLVGLVPVVGIVPKVAVAYAGTRLIGAAAWLWASEGRTLPRGEAKRLLTDSRRAAGELARSLRERLPSRPG